MFANSVVENVLGTIGTVLWTGQIIPQNWKSWREHSTDGLSAYLVLSWAIAALFQGVYNVTRNINIPLIVQPQLFGFFCALSFTQCLHYTHKRSFWFCALVLAAYSVIGAGFETGMVFISKHQVQKNNARPVEVFGILASTLIAVGLLPQYWEICKRKEVVGVSYIFMTVDISGAGFSLLSLLFKTRFDTVAAITYILVIIMDGIILVAAAILNPRARRRHAHVQSEESSLQAAGFRPDYPAVNEINEKEPTETDKPPLEESERSTNTLQDFGVRTNHPAVNEINEKVPTEADKLPLDFMEELPDIVLRPDTPTISTINPS